KTSSALSLFKTHCSRIHSECSSSSRVWRALLKSFIVFESFNSVTASISIVFGSTYVYTMRECIVSIALTAVIFAALFGEACFAPTDRSVLPANAFGDQGVCRRGYNQVLGRATSCRYTCSAGDIGEGADFYTGEMPNGHKCRQPGRFWGICKNGRCAPSEGVTQSE
ncbi:hypothetical protein BIW11_13048, partial [Tropilaelaps mercedesae]